MFRLIWAAAFVLAAGSGQFIFRLPSGGSFPPGVTLEDIDGGPTFYADNGYTYAAASFTVDGVSYSSMDDEDFFPIGLFLEKYNGTSAANKWDELNANFAATVQGDVDLSLMNTRGVRLGIQAGEWRVDNGNNLFHAVLLGNVVAIYSDDEPSTLSEAYADIEAFPCSGTPSGNTGQTSRPWLVTFQHSNVSFFDIQGVDMDDVMTSNRTTPCATTRQLDIPFVDQYFYSGAADRDTDAGGCSIPASPWPGNANRIYDRAGDMTSDLIRRGSRYGDLTRFIRLGNPNHGYPAFKSGQPMGVWIETGSPYNENQTETTAIRPEEINVAVWASLINGARFVLYFTLSDGCSFQSGAGLIGSSAFDTIYNGGSISNYDQVTATNALVRTMAPVLNSSTAISYATVSPAPQDLTDTVMESGIEFLVKYYDRGGSANNKFYIFAYPQYGDRTHNNSGADTGAESWPKTATFTIANTGSTQVTVINEARTISVTGSGTTFQDSFASAETVHIYRVD